MGTGDVRIGGRELRRLLAVGACVLTWAGIACSVAAGKTLYASPSGDGAACSAGTPCKVGEAVAKANDKDSVVLAAGAYDLPFTGLTIEDEIELGAAPGAPATLLTTETAGVNVFPEADATLHDLRLEGAGNLKLDSGAAERVYVGYAGVTDSACELGKGTSMRNSVCWTWEPNDEEEGESNALEISAGGSEGQDEPVVLRNVTAYAENDDGSGIRVFAGPGSVLEVDAANVIAHSVNDVDIAAEADVSPKTEAHLNIVNSSFGEFLDAPSKATVTPLGTSGNIAAAPAFANPTGGNFHVGGGSPTLDAGAADSSAGSLDLEGHDRAQAKCFGATPVPDMGAYERTPTDACPPPPPPPPPPVEPRKPVFRVLSLILNKKTGAGRVLVEVPEGGGTLSLTGSGVKLVRRTAPGEGGVISLPIQTWAITKVRLAKRGKTKVRLKVVFEGKSGGLREYSKGVLLRKKVKPKPKKPGRSSRPA